MHLYAVYVGGKTATSLIEVHDMMFVIGDTIEDTYSQLKNKWWGTPESLHLDAWVNLQYIDHYQIVLNAGITPSSPNKLYFVHLGGYDKNEFNELHKNVFVVAADEKEAKYKAKSNISSWQTPHVDHLIDVDSCIDINQMLNESGISISLQPTQIAGKFDFTCQYVPIGV